MKEEVCVCYNKMFTFNWKYKCGFNNIKDADNYLDNKIKKHPFVKYNTLLIPMNTLWPEFMKYILIYRRLLPILKNMN